MASIRTQSQTSEGVGCVVGSLLYGALRRVALASRGLGPCHPTRPLDQNTKGASASVGALFDVNCANDYAGSNSSRINALSICVKAIEGGYAHNSSGGGLHRALRRAGHGGGLRRHPSGLRRTLPNHRRYRPAKGLRQPMFDFVLPTNAPCGPSLRCNRPEYLQQRISGLY
jgi:hypothetical protein